MSEPTVAEMLSQRAAPLTKVYPPRGLEADGACPDDMFDGEPLTADLHAHPVLKKSWFHRRLWKPHKARFLTGLGLNFFDFNPLSVRTSYPKLREGGVNVMMSTAYVLEYGTIFDFHFTTGWAGRIFMWPFQQALRIPRALNVFGYPSLNRVPDTPFDPQRYRYPRTRTAHVAVFLFPLIGGAIFWVLAWLARRFLVPVLPGWLGWLTWVLLAVMVIIPVLYGWGLAVMAGFLRSLASAIEHRYYDQTNHDFDRIEEDVAHEKADYVDFARNHLQMDDLIAEGKIVMIHGLEGAHNIFGPFSGAYEYLEQRQVRLDRRGKAHQIPAILQELRPHAIAELIGYLDELKRRGVAMIGLNHYYPHIISQSAFSYPERALHTLNPGRWDEYYQDPTRGLTEMGREIIPAMLERGFILDMSHVSPTTRSQVYELIHQHGGNVVGSHIGVQGVYRHPYNLSDYDIEQIGSIGGAIGIMFSNYWLSGHETVKLGLGYMVDCIEHIRRVLAGYDGMAPGLTWEDIVAFGSDYDGFSNPPDELIDAARWPELTRYLCAVGGYEERQVRKFLGENFVRVLRSVDWGV